MPRISCLNCYRKHVSTAIVLMQESQLGYKLHRWLAVGELSQAEAESLVEYPSLAESTRQERVKIMEDDNYLGLRLMELLQIATDIAEANFALKNQKSKSQVQRPKKRK